MRRGLAWGGLLAAMLLAPAAAYAEDGWHAFHAVDPVTDQVREGASFTAGADRFLVVCTHNKTGPDRFWITVQTDSHLGRKSTRKLIYRVGDEPATTSNWDYMPRQASPSWPLEDKHIVQRLLKGGDTRLVLRLGVYDGGVHDVTVPVDAQARELMTRTLSACGAPTA